jgi:hypothetical protein
MAPPSVGRQIQGTVREVFRERLVPGRECDGCIVCCKILDINWAELKKPSGIICPHNTGQGCGIHATRPDGCRTWFCLWRRIDELPEYTRPDRIGVMFSIDWRDPPRTPFENFYIVARALNGWQDFDQPQAAAAVRMFVEEGTLPVWLSFNGNKLLIYPNKELADAVTNPASAAEHLRPPVEVWRKRLNLD